MSRLEELGYDELGLRHSPPLSAHRRPPSLPPTLSDLVERGDAAMKEPLVGITTDGSPRRGLFPLGPTGVSTGPVVDAAAAFLASLDDAQREAVTFAVDADEWRTWCNVHTYLWRHGLLLEDLAAAPRAAALALAAGQPQRPGLR